MGYKYQPANTRYKREWMRRRRAEFLKDKKCKKCGTKRTLVISWGLSKDKRINFSASPARLEDALKGVPVLCKKCWNTLIGTRRSGPIKHGTTWGYKRKCRCKKCKAAEAERARAYRKRYKKAHPGVRELKRRRLAAARRKLQKMLPLLKKRLGTVA